MTPNLTPEIFTCTQLLNEVIPAPQWAIPGLITEGACILAGRPKACKSLLAHHVGLAVATGSQFLRHYKCAPGDVLYIALEDNKRRLQDRTRKLLAGMGVPPNDHFFMARTWPKARTGGLTQIQAWLDKHPAARLVIVDTLARIREAVTKNNGTQYADDYEVVAAFQGIAIERNILIMILTHTRKPKGQDPEQDDPLDEVTGTTGITAGADSILVLRRKRNSNIGKLFVYDRDTEDAELDLRLDPSHCLWSFLNNQSPDDGLTPERRRFMAAIKAGHKKADTIAKYLNIAPNTAQQALRRMANDGQLSKTRHGEYDIPMSVCQPVSLPKEPHTLEILTH
jgi:hypothetical protein